MTQTEIERPSTTRTTSRFATARRFLSNLSVGTLSLLVLVGAGVYVMSPPAEAFAMSPPLEVSDSSGTRVVYGRVTDRFNHPLAAAVRVTSRSGRPAVNESSATQSDGTYRIELPRPGNYRLTVTSSHAVGHRNFTIRRTSAIRIDAVLFRRARFSIGPISSY